MLENLLKELRKASPPAGKRVRIIHTGLVFDPLEIYKLFDKYSIDIVDDDIANGWRTASKGELNTNNRKPAPVPRAPVLEPAVSKGGHSGGWYQRADSPQGLGS